MNSKLALLAPILIGLLMIEIGVLTGLQFSREAEREAARVAALEEREKADAERRAEDKARTEPSRVSLKQALHECSATNSDATCYLTNFDGPPIVTCMQGLLVQKEAAGVRLYSMPMCSGPIRPNETRAVSAPWSGGRASDICKSASGYLDFGKCDFTVIDYVQKP